MNKKNKIRFDSKGRGSALILVVVVTVLLSVIGIMFLMVSRVGDMMGTAARQEYEMDQAVGAVTARIEHVLMQDLFGRTLSRGIADNTPGASNEPFDAPGSADPWLASLEPAWDDNGTPADPTDDIYEWPYISNIWHSQVNFGDGFWDRVLRDGTWPSNNGLEWGAIVPDYQNLTGYYITPADADGDGVADSVWIPLPNPTGSGENIYAAVRIIDNCAMLNLNTAHMTRKASGWSGQGRWLSEVDYEAFLRGDDRANPIVIKRARMTNLWDPFDLFEQHHDRVIMNIENPGPSYTLFDLADELEIRNRFLLTSKAQARFEQETRLTGDISTYRFGCYETFDWGRGEYVGGWTVPLRSKRIPIDSSEDLGLWKQRLNSINFDDSDPANTYGYYYDRRHLCTFYSFDRNLRWGGDPFLATLSAADLGTYGESYKKLFMPADAKTVSVRASILPEDNTDPVIAAQNKADARRRILPLLYAFRAYYLGQGDPLPTAARRAAQIVANMIDYFDDSTAGARTGPFSTFLFGSQLDASPTYIDNQIVNRMIAELSAAVHNNEDPSVPFFPDTAIPAALDFGLAAGDVVYGFERQPFISELYVHRNNTNNTVEAALELINPYDTALSLANWRIVFNRISASTPFTIPVGTTIPAGTPAAPGRLVIRSNVTPPVNVTLTGFGMGTLLADANSIDVQRPSPANPSGFITVDRIPRGQIQPMLTDNPADGQPTYHALKRQDSGWKFTNANAFVHQQAVPPATSPDTLGAANGITVPESGWQMPVADLNPISVDRKFYTLGDFQKVLFVGNQGNSDPNTVTSVVAGATTEGDIRFDILNDPDLLGFICFLNREKGSLPGRININTAPKHVLAAAIPGTLSPGSVSLVDPVPATTQVIEDYADLIINNRPFANIGELLNIPDFQIFANTGGLDVIGDLSIKGDFEERDIILSHLSNIFTARSDVFTAYILVRLGQNGPQRRVMAIFDRSQVWTAEDRPRIIAIKTIPNPR